MYAFIFSGVDGIGSVWRKTQRPDAIVVAVAAFSRRDFGTCEADRRARWRAGVRKPQTRFFRGGSAFPERNSPTSVAVRMPMTVTEQAANGKVFSRCFLGTGATARALPRERARAVTERRELELREPPGGRTGVRRVAGAGAGVEGT